VRWARARLAAADEPDEVEHFQMIVEDEARHVRLAADIIRWCHTG